MNTNIDFKAFEKAMQPMYGLWDICNYNIYPIFKRNHCMYQDDQYILTGISFEYFKGNLGGLIDLYIDYLIQQNVVPVTTAGDGYKFIHHENPELFNKIQERITQCILDNIPNKTKRFTQEELRDLNIYSRTCTLDEFYPDVFNGTGERLFEIIDSYRNHITDLLAFKVVSIPQDENNNIEGHENVVVECDFDNAEPLPGREVINTPAITTADIVAISIIVAMMIFVGWLFYHYLIGY